MNSSPATPLLDRVKTPEDLRKLPESDLKQLADELRQETISAVSVTGGHLGAGLGVVELTVALHYVFDTPRDKLIWDVGHQAYPHKILTGRRDRIRTLRQPGGLSGFTKRAESEYDPFGAAHSSTSISAALGMAVARDLKGGTENVVAVIGDGAMSAGMAYEAMNNAGHLKSRLIVILNDNDMSIAPPVGAMSTHLAKLVSGPTYRGLQAPGQADRRIPAALFPRAGAAGGRIHPQLLDRRHAVRGAGLLLHRPDRRAQSRPSAAGAAQRRRDAQRPGARACAHQEGQGLRPGRSGARQVSRRRQVRRDHRRAGQEPLQRAGLYKVFAESLIKEAEKDERIVAVTAAMPAGTGLDLFGEKFPTRTFDVGIAEQHAVTFAAGLATQGFKPFTAIYSTFLQRAYDQVVHDVAIQSLPVRFAIDRAGFVGADGQTHAGAFDTAYLACLPGFVVMAAADEAELVHMVATAAAIDDRPSSFRYPRGDGVGVEMPERGRAARDRPRPHPARGRQGGAALLRRAPQGMPQGGRRPRFLRPADDGRRCPLRQAARHRTSSTGWCASTRC